MGQQNQLQFPLLNIATPRLAYQRKQISAEKRAGMYENKVFHDTRTPTSREGTSRMTNEAKDATQ